MLNKKIQLELGGRTFQLWFNNYAVCELQSMYGIEQTEVMKKIVERATDNYLLLIVDLVKAGLRGYYLAKEEVMPNIKVSELIADADMDKLVKVLEVFYDVMGVNLKDDKKKVAPKSRSSRKKS